MNNKTTKIVMAVLAVAVIAVGAVMLGSKKANQNGSNSSSKDQTASVIITHDGAGFSPSAVNVDSGDTIKIVNQSKEVIEPSSNPHPLHTDNSELNFGDIEAGQSKTVTLTAKGTWGYHNHYATDQQGTITVE